MVADAKAWDVGKRIRPSAHEYHAMFISDVHMSNSLPHAKAVGDYGVTDRLLDQRKLWEQVEDAINIHHLDGLYIIGDLFDHAKADVITLTETAKIIKRLSQRCPVYLIPGNHDAHSTNGERFNLEAFATLSTNVVCSSLRSFTEPMSPPHCHDWLRFWMLEYAPVEKTKDWLEGIRTQISCEHRDFQNILLIHNAITGCSHGGWVCDTGLDANYVCDGFTRVLAGHFHDHQTFGPDGIGMYLGAPMHHRFDDQGRPTYAWIGKFVKDKAPKFTSVPLVSPRFYEIEYSEDMSGALEGLLERDYVRIKVEATHPDWVMLKPVLKEVVDELLSRGLNASAVHKPIYHHKSRLKSSKPGGKVVASLEDYVDSDHVILGDLDRAELIKFGKEIMAEVIHGKR